MLPINKMSYQISLVVFFQISSIWTAPIKIIQASPQVMMHNLQQPPPIETLQSVKAQKLHQDLQTSMRLQQMLISNLQQQMATNTLRELAKIQALQYAPSQIDLQMTQWLPQNPAENMQQPVNPWQQQVLEEQQQMLMPMFQQMSEDAMQEIALQQQMLSLQQMQAFNQMNSQSVHSPYPLPLQEPVLILLPDKNVESTDHGLYKNTNEQSSQPNETTYKEHEDEEPDAVVVDSTNETEPESPKGTRKAILLIPNARISIGGIISQIPWLPIEVNVPDTAIWAWNGIYDGISSIISIIGSRLPWRPRPQEAVTEPSVKMFLKQLQRKNYDLEIPAYPLSLDTVIPIHFNG